MAKCQLSTAQAKVACWLCPPHRPKLKVAKGIEKAKKHKAKKDVLYSLIVYCHIWFALISSKKEASRWISGGTRYNCI